MDSNREIEKTPAEEPAKQARELTEEDLKQIAGGVVDIVLKKQEKVPPSLT